MDFASDNRAPAAPAILEAIAAENARFGPAYGDDAVTARVSERLAATFEAADAIAFPVVTGTAANALALSAACPPWGAVICHEEAHVQVDECGAPEMMAGGIKLLGVGGEGAKIDPDALRAALDRHVSPSPHWTQPAVLSLTQPTERGTLYTFEEIDRLAGMAKRHGLRVHLDGARLANAIAAMGGSPADHTWRRGVDVLSLGATKSGAIAAEAVIFFSPELAEGFAWRRKRAGHLVSKMRFVSAQLEAWLEGDRWLALADRANAMARRLAAGLEEVEGVTVAHGAETNMVFVRLPATAAAALRARGFSFFAYEVAAEPLTRLVCSHATTPAMVDALLRAARESAG